MIRVTIDVEEDGTPVISVEGAKGEECYKETESLEKLGKVLSDEKTEEYYERAKERKVGVLR